MDYTSLLTALLLTPLISAVIIAFLPKKLSAKIAIEAVHVIMLAVVLILGMTLVVHVMSSGSFVISNGQWFRMDSLASLFVALVVLISVATGIFSLPYIRHDIEEGLVDGIKFKVYYVFYSLFVLTMLLAACSNNIIVMWAAVEATTLSTVFLVGLYSKKSSLEAAWKYIVVCAAGLAFGLLGTLLVYANATDVMADPRQAVLLSEIVKIAGQLDPAIMKISFVFIVIGFGTKAGLFPMNTWLPDAHSEAPSPVSALLSGVLLKCAMLVIIRFYILTGVAVGFHFPQVLMMVLGILSVVVAAFSMYAQNDVKRLLAYCSTENVGVIAVALGFGGPLGIAAALLHCVTHGMTKALTFLVTGNMMMKYGTRDMNKISGMIEVAPISAILVTISFLAISGFPPFAMFISEIMMYTAGVAAGQWAIIIIMIIALTIVIASFAKAIMKMVLGKAPEGMKKKDISIVGLIPEIALAIVILWVGVSAPSSLIHGVETASVQVLTESQQVTTEDFGILGIIDGVDGVQTIEINN